MAFQVIKNVAIRGISAGVPKEVADNKDLPFYTTPEEAEQVIEQIGIAHRHVSSSDITAVDLCYAATIKLLDELHWEKDSIDLIAFVTQQPDYLNHPNSFLIHEKLGLSDRVMCLDFFHGCPGWIVGLSSVASMIMTGNVRRAILLDGDTVSKFIGVLDRESKPLFGDAGTATALEYDENAAPMYFNIGTLSEDGRALIHLSGGTRCPYTMESLKAELDWRSGVSLDTTDIGKMDGMDVFSFAITKVPKAIKKLCANYSLDIATVDNLFLHQANKMIVENIAKRMAIPMEKTPMSLWEYGNTTSASIPLTMVSERSKELGAAKQKNLLCGFGTGLAWGAAYVETENVICPPIVEL